MSCDHDWVFIDCSYEDDSSHGYYVCGKCHEEADTETIERRTPMKTPENIADESVYPENNPMDAVWKELCESKPEIGEELESIKFRIASAIQAERDFNLKCYENWYVKELDELRRTVKNLQTSDEESYAELVQLRPENFHLRTALAEAVELLDKSSFQHVNCDGDYPHCFACWKDRLLTKLRPLLGKDGE